MSQTSSFIQNRDQQLGKTSHSQGLSHFGFYFLFVALFLGLLAGCTEKRVPIPIVKKIPSKSVKKQSPRKVPVFSEDILLLQKAEAFLSKGNIKEAAITLQKLIDTFPNAPSQPEALVKLANIFKDQGHVEQAIDLLITASQQLGKPFATKAALDLADIYYSQDRITEAWTLWSSIIKARTPPAQTAWNRVLESYFDQGTQENTLLFLDGLTATPFTQERTRLLLQQAGLQSKDHLQTLLTFQPPGSLLTPFLQLYLADQLAKNEQEEEAQALWQQALNTELTSMEARRRLHPNVQETPLMVGLLLPLSDRWTNLGKHLIKSAYKALMDHRDANIELIIADSGASAEVSREAVMMLHSKGVQVIIGPVFHTATQAAIEVAAIQNIPLISMNPHREGDMPLPNIYANAFHPEQQARAMARYAVLVKKHHRIAILAPESDYGRSVARLFTDEVESLGESVVRVVHYPDKSLDFSPWIKALVHMDPKMLPKRLSDARHTLVLDPTDLPPPTKREDLEPWADFDALFLPVTAKEIRLIAPQAAFFNIISPHVELLGTALWNRPELLESGTDYLRGAVFCDTQMAEREYFDQTFNKAFGEKSTLLSSLTYDSVAILAQLLRDQRLGGPSWSKGLTRTSGFLGSSGRVRFLDNGQSRRPYHLFKIKRKKIQFLQPVPEAILPETILPETILPEAVLPKTTLPEAVLPEAVLSEAILPKTISPKTISPKTILPTAISPIPAKSIPTNSKIDHSQHTTSP